VLCILDVAKNENGGMPMRAWEHCIPSALNPETKAGLLRVLLLLMISSRFEFFHGVR